MLEGQNIALEYRYADEKTERLLDLATELISLRVNVLVATYLRTWILDLHCRFR